MIDKMVICKTCGNKIAKTAKRCPHCGAQQHVAALAIAGLLTAFIIIAVIYGFFVASGLI